MSSHRENIDPFNAGEPEMPWDAPAADQPSDSGSSASTRLSKRTKRTQPKSQARPKSPSSGKRTTGTGSSKPRARIGAIEPDSNYQAPIYDAKAYDTKPYNAPTVDGGSTRKHSGSSSSRSSSSKKAKKGASSQTASTSKKSKSGCGGLIGFIIFVAIVGPSILGLLSTCARATFSINTSDSSNDATTSYEETKAKRDEAKKKASEETKKLATKALDSYKDPKSKAYQELHQALATEFAENTKNYTMYSAEELGIDPNAYADAVIKNFSYTIDDGRSYASPIDDYSKSGYATVSFSLTYTDLSKFYDVFYSPLYKYLSSKQLYGSSTGNYPLTDEARAYAQDLYKTQLAQLTTTTDSMLTVSLTQEQSTKDGWVIKEDRLKDSINSFFGVY